MPARRVRRVSPPAVLAAAFLAGAALAGFFVSNGSAQDQERTLLEADAGQASLFAGSAFSSVGPYLDDLATAVALSGGSPAVFAERARALVGGAGESLVLAHRQGGLYVVDSAVGSGFSAGQALSPAMSAVLARAGATLTPGPVLFDGRTSSSFFAVGPPLTPAGSVVFLSSSVHPFVPSQVTAAKPFAQLRVAVYGAASASEGSLLVSTVRPSDLPLADAVVTHFTVGNARWTLVAQARAPLQGSFACQAPYIVLALGLLLALLVGAMLEVLDRRSRYATRVAREKTTALRETLAELRDSQEELVRAERLTALGEMALAVGHELRNPLAAVVNSLYLLRLHLGGHGDPRCEEHLAMAERETAKAASLAGDLAAFVRPREPRKEHVDVVDVVHEVLAASPPPEHVALEVDTEAVAVLADRGQIAEMLTNLVTNAYQAVNGAGSVRVSARHEGDSVELAVEDSGPGIDAAAAGRVFEPFVTTKHDGTGLGLAIVRRLVEGHGGRVDFERSPGGRGARVVVRLPADTVPEPQEVLS